jgi:hypothetical protein
MHLVRLASCHWLINSVGQTLRRSGAEWRKRVYVIGHDVEFDGNADIESYRKEKEPGCNAIDLFVQSGVRDHIASIVRAHFPSSGSHQRHESTLRPTWRGGAVP